MVARLFDGCARAVRHHDFAHHQHAVGARGVRIDGDRLEDAIGVVAFRLHGRRAVKTPQRQLLERRKRVEVLELGLAAQVRRRRVAVEPDVFELVFGHSRLSCADRAIICVPRRALPQIAAESKAPRRLPPAFKHFVCQSALRPDRAAAARRIAGTARPNCCEPNEQKCECSYCSHALIFCEAYRTKVGQSIILRTTQETGTVTRALGCAHGQGAEP